MLFAGGETYTPVITRVKPTTKAVKIWSKDADSTLQRQFRHTDWSVFAADTTDSQTNIHTYTSSVLDYIKKCVEGVTTHKTVKLFSNQKPWMNKEVRLLLKARDTALRSGDREAYSSARSDLRKGISRAKLTYKKRIEEHFNSSDPRRMWQGLNTITNKARCNSSLHSSTSLADELNHLYTRFDRENEEAAVKLTVSSDEDTLQFSTSDVRDILPPLFLCLNTPQPRN
ncbi:hypothetical protein F2P81_002520 [Scophthalmus maximus]|uniref:Uncharacterized protein n=1 Tax=Scophthalmus maximus TaxID=52904 RepID=A0A6A4TTG2_SCOMX|nr:hypothetical protein F2P81_002520 [Scophthalmus maximus]